MNAPSNDFFEHYLQYTSGTEVPTFYHRWAAIVGLGAWIGKGLYFQHGDMKVYPNMYAMLLGQAGTRKSTAIKRMKKIFTQAGYENFSVEKVTKEKFLLDLAGQGDEQEMEDIDSFLSGGFDDKVNAECCIAADEFNDFFGNDIFGFLSLLGVFWDYDGVYKNRIKNGVSVEIPDPTISIIGGNTQTTFANTFPAETIGQGFFSRMIAVYAEPTSKKITFPTRPSEDATLTLIRHLHEVKNVCLGEVIIGDDALKLLDKIYQAWKPLTDERFASYGNRRLTHLIKLCVIHAAARCSQEVTTDDVRNANTVLTFTEHFMPKAYGEFGQARNSGPTNKILNIIESQGFIDINEIWQKMNSDLENQGRMNEILTNLLNARKIQSHGNGFMPVKPVLDMDNTEFLNYDYLTDAEKFGE